MTFLLGDGRKANKSHVFLVLYQSLTPSLVRLVGLIKVMAETKRCPYCGEEILAVAKKCKHCGEWLDKTVTVKEEKKIPCPTCGELVVETTSVCPYCHEKIEKPSSLPRNAFREKVISEKIHSSKEDNDGNKKWIWIVVTVALVAIVCAIIFSSKSGSSVSTDNTYANDSMVEVEVMAVEEVPEYPEDENEIVEIPGMIQHTEEQGKYTPGDYDPWNE